MTSLTESIGALVEPHVSAAGLKLWDIEQTSGVLRVLVDRDGGVDLDHLGPLAQAISDELDAHPALLPDARYQLEVSSPGVERTMRTPEHYQAFIGALVSLKTSESIDGSRRFQGILDTADGSGIRLVADGSPVEIRYSQIQKAHTVLVWGPAPKPGTPRAKTAAGAGRPQAQSMKDSAT